MLVGAMAIASACGNSSCRNSRMKPGWKSRCVTSHLGPASGTRLSTVCSRLLRRTGGAKPLVSHEVVVNLIGATTTTKGLRVKSELDPNHYPAGRVVTDD